jgi:Ca-activated chloride channel homolog
MISRMICSGCLMIAVVAASFAQASGPRVNLSLIVADKTNKSVSTFRKEDVRVFEDKVEQTILSIEPDERSVDVGLLIDASGSLRSLLPSVLEAAQQIIRNQRAPDEFFIESFVSSDKIARVQDFTGDVNVLIDALKLIKIQPGQSAVLDGIYTGAVYLAKHNNTAIRRKVLILITDGEDRNSRSRLNEVLKQLRAEDIQVFVIGLITDLDNEVLIARQNPQDKARKLLTTLAEQSGGLVFFPRNRNDLINAANLIGDALRAQFRIIYQSSKEPTKTESRKVEVKLSSTSGEKLKAIAPRSYYVEAIDVTKKTTEPKSP